MAEEKKRDLVEPDSILDEEDEATLAAIDRGIKAADESRVVSFEEARLRLRERIIRSSSQKTRS
jgi:predicted transcriptional regulator